MSQVLAKEQKRSGVGWKNHSDKSKDNKEHQQTKNQTPVKRIVDENFSFGVLMHPGNAVATFARKSLGGVTRLTFFREVAKKDAIFHE